jgi:triphosphoribosyl-dephospho-CoA synthase
VKPSSVAALVQAACVLEATAPKPGNVSPGRDFADTTYADFVLSAAAIGPAFARAGGRSVGATILEAVRDTRELAGRNTNLGLVLLLAPLARAASREGGPLRLRLGAVLSELDQADARDAYAAIRLAAPGGLGDAPEEDVAQEPTVTLREAMMRAADRDSVAREYSTHYDLTFGTVVPALVRARSAGASWLAAAVEAHLETLARVPDTLIARKLGAAMAREASRRAEAARDAGPERRRALEELDAWLRADGNRRNPGTTADLVGAGLFVAMFEEKEQGG